MPLNWPNTDVRVRRLVLLTIIGSCTLLAGIVVFCHAELRGAHYIGETNALFDELDNLGLQFPDGESAESRQRRDRLWNSFFRERWWGFAVLIPVGAGVNDGIIAR